MFINSRNLLGHTTGVQRYTQRIIDHLDFRNEDYKLVQPDNVYPGFIGHAWEQFVLPRKIGESILWSPCNTGPISISNQVVTIHDTVVFDHPEWLNNKFVAWYKFIQPKMAKKVKHIITISDFSKNKIMEHLKVPENKISVVYNGVDIKKTPSVEENSIYGGMKYLLTVGSLEPRKNIQRLCEAFSAILGEIDPEIKLVIVGKEGVSRVFKDATHKKNDNLNDRIIFTGHISDNQLYSLYDNAIGFCYPSMYEGFGLPPLEAMSFGIPVLTSNNTSMRELCENKAILVDPYSVDDIAQGIISLLRQDKNSAMSIYGRDFAKSLSWEKCTNETIDIITSL
ncbi:MULTISPECIES: glycosyltransferase family 1 protein [unclassified Serratia (in: enterobacteria)]|uniref:glycosyltransferase family 4 protein n=1 Tax=unclassified Serratia (in: enterobacteria) TaxID=2647522 RepID=UPI00046A48EC|nr:MULTISPECIES: glycosyltransferase family 1 protein [unclassified Serratia (in: enterobacteria)]